MRIRFFNTFEPVTTIYRDLFPYLAEEVGEIQVFMSKSEYRPERGLLEEAIISPNVKVVRISSGGLIARGRFRKPWIMLTYVVGSIVRSLFGSHADINIFLSQPPLFAYWGVFLKAIRGQHYYCLLMDMYPDIAQRSGYFSWSSLVFKFLKRIRMSYLRHATGIIVIGRCMAKLVEELGVVPERIHYIPNWADEDHIVPFPHSDNPLRRKLELNGKFIVLYSGNLGISHSFDELTDVAQNLLGNRDICIVIIGEGVRREQVSKSIDGLMLDNVFLLPYQPESELAQSLSLGDIHYISLRDGFEGLLVPSKAYGALAAGRPILYQGDPRGEIAQMILEEGVGTVVPNGDKNELCKMILTYYENENLLIEQGERARKLAETKYSKYVALEKYQKLLFRD